MNNQIEIKAIFGKMTCKYMQYKKQMFSRKTKHNSEHTFPKNKTENLENNQKTENTCL